MRSASEGQDALELARLLPPGRHELVELGPLSLGALRHVLSGAVSAITRPALRRIHELSGGNPLYAIELARSLPALGNPLPDSLQGAIAARLDAVPVELVPLLETVSALGRSSIGELRAVHGPVESLLASAQAHELLTVDESLEARFVHPLLGSAVYGRMSAPARRSLHGRLAAGATDPDARARHVALSTDRPDSAAAELLEEAANHAAERGAFDLAAELTRHSLRLTQAKDGDALRRRTVAELAHLTAAGEVSRARALADRLIAELPAGPTRAEVILERVYAEDDDIETNEALLARALAEAEGDERLRGFVLDTLGWRRGMARGDLAGGIRCAREAAAIAEQLGDTELELYATAGLAVMEALAGSPRPAAIERAATLATEHDASLLWAGPRAWLARHRLWAGDLLSARESLEQIRAETLRAGNEFRQPYLLHDLALIACAAGELQEAWRLLGDALESARDGEDGYVQRRLLHSIALVSAWRGDATAARSAADRLLQEASERGERPSAARARRVRGLLALSENRLEVAAAELVEAARLLEEMGIAHPAAFPVLPDAVEALSRAGDLDRAEALLARLERQASAISSKWAVAAAERSRGVLLLGHGDAEAAAPILEHALRSFERLGFRPDAARAALARGRALFHAGRRGRAADALADGRARFSDMGATLWEARATEELERVAPGRGAGALTPAERRVAAHVAAGMRNREIGRALFMSVATVEAHLTRTYRKLGIRSRSELARLVAEGRIPPGQGEGL